MNGSPAVNRVLRLGTVCVVLVGLLLTLGWPGFAVGAADPGPIAAGTDPLLSSAGASPPIGVIPDHRGQQAYFASLRQAPPGVSAGAARATAAKQAQGLPTVPTLPAALGGKGAPIRDALAPPSAVWQQLGPQPQDSNTSNPSLDYQFGKVTGRASSIVVGPHTGVLYAGFADGGVWKSTNDGASWTATTDNQLTLAIGALALDPTDPTDNTLYAGTGESVYDVQPGGFNGDAYFGMGVLKTVDGGKIWTLLGSGFPNWNTYSATSVGIGVMAANGATVWAGTTEGLYQSTNGGATWVQVTVASGSPNARVTDLVLDGTNMYVVLSETDNGHSDSGIYKSTTGGTVGSFSPIMMNLPAATTWGFARVTIARSSPQTLYLNIVIGSNVANTGGNLLTPNGVFKTTNGGTSWTATTQPPFDPLAGQGFYDNVITVDPGNASLVYFAGVHVVQSQDGGTTWTTMVDVYCGGGPLPCSAPIHPDNHAIAFGPSGTPRPLYIGNDGGIFKTANGNLGASATWTNLNTNLATTQFYAADAAANFNTNSVVIGGAQDNGTSRTASAAAGTWNSVLGGDGGYVGIDKTAVDTVFAEAQNGDLFRTTNANAGTSISLTFVAPKDPANGNKICNSTLFVAPFALDPNAAAHSHIAFGGGGYVCETIDGGSHWFYSNGGGGGLFFGQFVQSVAIAPANSAVVYAGTTGGRIFRTTSGNVAGTATWSDIWTGKGLPAAPVTAIAVDRNDGTGNIAYATFGNFGVGHVWKTVDGGTSWSDITHNLPDAPTTSITTYPTAGNPVLVVGTDIGVFLSTNNGTSWSALMNGLPRVGVQMVFTDTALTTLFVGTHGRGVFKMPIPASDAFAAPTTTAILPSSGPTAGATVVTVTGTGFRTGAAVSFDGVAATNVVVVNATTITAVTPAHQDGKANVVVVNTDNRGGTLAQGFTFGAVNVLPGSKPSSGSGSPAVQPNPRPSGSPQGSPGVLPNPKPRG